VWAPPIALHRNLSFGVFAASLVLVLRSAEGRVSKDAQASPEQGAAAGSIGHGEYPMSDSFTVFVCSTFDDLEQEREAVLDAIRRVQSRHNAMEFFGARPGRPINVCLDEVGKSDLLVIIVGLKYGSLPPGMKVSYSQAEYEEGVRLEKACLVYLRDDDVRILPKNVERDPDKLKLLEAWKQALNASHTVAKFASWPKLAVQVAADIGYFLLQRQSGARLIRADLARLNNDRPEFATIRASALALIDKGDFEAARAKLNEGRAAARASRDEASRTEAQFLAESARVDLLQLKYDAACTKFAKAASLDQGNFRIWIELGDLWVKRGSLAKATKAFAAARDVAKRSGDDRDLSVSYDRIGDVQKAQGDLAGALNSYRDSLAIRERLA
jgi:hypothetical protein